MLSVLQLWEEIDIEERSDEADDGEEDNTSADDTVDEYDSRLVETRAYLVNEPSQPIPPQQCAAQHGSIARTHKQRLVGHDEVELCEECDEEQHDKWVGEGDEKRRHPVVYQRALLLLSALVRILQRVGEEADESEDQQHDATGKLQIELVDRITDEVDDERHSETGDEGIDKVTEGCSHACGKAIPPALLLCALHAENADGPHGCGSRDADYNAFYNQL